MTTPYLDSRTKMIFIFGWVYQIELRDVMISLGFAGWHSRHEGSAVCHVQKAGSEQNVGRPCKGKQWLD